MKAKWYSLWYSGEYKPTQNVWADWHTLVSDFFDRSDLTLTHFGARAARFRSGKYLQYRRGRKRLLQALADQDDFKYLSYLEMQTESFNTLAGDNSFHATLNSRGVEVDVRLDHYSEQLCDSFRSVAEQLFKNARLITFRTPDRVRGIPCLPCNLPANYDREGDIVQDYIDITTSHIGSDN